MSKSGERLEEVRSALGLNQAEFGALLGTVEITVRRYEKSEPKLDEDKCNRLMGVGIDPAYILTGNTKDYTLKGYTMKQARELARKAIGKEVNS